MSDIYSFEVILWKISSGMLPFKLVGFKLSLVFYIINSNRKVLIANTPKKYKDLYSHHWDSNLKNCLEISFVLKELKVLISNQKPELMDLDKIEDIKDNEKILNYRRQLRNAILEYQIGHLDYAAFINFN
ncbi:kinase-like protein [Gigaspora margarita]|uniref:Kinase-like protein n=1 Tax=Gigaspora margarita TaxID=4874 RepID=A0A8H4AL33_GIGMA|nr:kinase-like protein [Gigaspora margarita]